MCTVHPSVIRLDMSFFHFPILSDQCVALGTVVAEDCGGVEGQVEIFGELAGWIAEETDLIW